MSDRDWRDAERRYATQPGDPAALEVLIRARRRAGLAVAHLLEDRVWPSREVSSELKLRVSVRTTAGQELALGETGRGPITIPAHKQWFVRPAPVKLSAALVDELRALQLPGLSLERARIGDHDLAALTDLPDLRWLSLRSCGGIGSAGVAHLGRQLPQLEYLDLSGCHGLTAGAVTHLTQLPRLNELRCENLEWGDADLAVFGGLTQLGALSLRGLKGKLRGDGLSHLAPLKHLVHLDLSNCRDLSGKRCQAMPALPELRSLDLHWAWNLTDPALPMLERQERLEELTLGTNKFTVAGLRGCARLQQLRALRVCEVEQYRSRQCDPKQFRKLTDEVFDWIATLPALESLSLEHLSPWITDAGLARLAEVARLHQVTIVDCFGISGDGARALSSARPELAIRRGKLQLGAAPPEPDPVVPLAPVVRQLLSVLSLKRLHQLAREQGVVPENKRTKAAAQAALAEVALSPLLEFLSTEELAKGSRRLKLKVGQWTHKPTLAAQVRRLLGEGA